MANGRRYTRGVQSTIATNCGDSGRQPPISAHGAQTAELSPLACSAVLTHHWLTRRRGGEKVLEALATLLPGAPIYTLVFDAEGMEIGAAKNDPLAGRAVHTSFLQRIPTATRNYPKLLPLMPLAARRMRLPPVDLVVCSDAAVAKAMRADARSRVVCYCHSPPRYAFDATIGADYRARLPLLARPLWDMTLPRVRRADRAAAARVDVFVANSQHVAERISRWYGRESVVVHPPVDLPAAASVAAREDFYVCVGFHAPYKRLDLAIDACRRLRRRLIVIGEGPGVPSGSARMAAERDGVSFLGWQPDSVIKDHYARAQALLFPGEEDFGIVPVEAMASGCPVVGYGVGGACETVIPGVTGVLFSAQTAEALANGMQECERSRFEGPAMHAAMQRFSRGRFLMEMNAILRAALQQKP